MNNKTNGNANRPMIISNSLLIKCLYIYFLFNLQFWPFYSFCYYNISSTLYSF